MKLKNYACDSNFVHSGIHFPRSIFARIKQVLCAFRPVKAKTPNPGEQFPEPWTFFFKEVLEAIPNHWPTREKSFG